MASSARWVDIPGTANILKISTADVLKMIQNGQCVTQLNGSTTEVLFDFDPKRNPKYILAKPGQQAGATVPPPASPPDTP
jgi:hypothetical protein